MTRSDDDHLVLLIDVQDLRDLIVKIPDVVAVALLTEAAEVIEVLTDLRRRELHPLT